MRAPGQVFDDGKTSKSPLPKDTPMTSPATEVSAPPWRRKRHQDFEGDVAVAELRSRLALTPERVPEPPRSTASSSRILRMTRLAIAATAVGVASACLWEFKLSTRIAKPTPGPAQALLTQAPAATLAALDRDFDLPAAAPPATGFAPADTRDEARQTSASHATSIDAPQQPATLRPQAVSPPAALRPPAAADEAPLVAAKMKIGVELMTYGEVVAARVMFQRAAEAGDGAGAFALAETYDPLVLEELRLREKITPNIALARTWYERARELGSLEARDRISRLAQLPR